MASETQPPTSAREGSLEAPERHTIDWRSENFYDESALLKEMERVFDICHGCRRCFSLCNAFPTLFDAVDESPSMELDSVDKQVYWQVVDHCYLCDMCFMTKCPYVPPHEWNVDFPHLMLRAKAVKHKKGDSKFSHKVLTNTDQVGSLAGIPVVSGLVNFANRNRLMRKVTQGLLGVHAEANLPAYHTDTALKRLADKSINKVKVDTNRENVLIYATCYGNFNDPDVTEDLLKVLEHNDVNVAVAQDVRCCGMPKLELGDFNAVEKLKDNNVPKLAQWIDQGWTVIAPVPSCVLMYKQELPLMFPEDKAVAKVRDNIQDPFDLLMQLHKKGKLKTDFKQSLGKVAYHVACHLRVQNLGLKTRDILQLVPDTKVEPIERCSGHDGTYAVKKEFYETAMKIVKPVVNRVSKSECDHYGSDCPMAGKHIEHGLGHSKPAEHPLRLLRIAYGIE